jgi:hypothetical protein
MSISHEIPHTRRDRAQTSLALRLERPTSGSAISRPSVRYVSRRTVIARDRSDAPLGMRLTDRPSIADR